MSFISTYLPFYRRNLKVAGPIVLSQVGAGVVQLVDTFMVGRLGTIELASVSFATSVFVIVFIASNGLLMGATPIIGQLFSQNIRPRIAQILQNALLLAVVSSIIMMMVLLIIRGFMPYMGQDVRVVELAVPYFTVMIISLFPYMIFTAFKQFLEGLGNTSVAMIITITANLVNILFNYFLIFGKCGFPQMGVLGAAISTLLSRILMPLLFLPFLRFRADWWEYCKQFRMQLFDWATIRELLSLGIPIALQILLEVSAFALSAIMVGWLGAPSLAGHQIAANMSNIVFMVVLGISAATTIRVSHQYGASDFKAMRMAANASIHLCLMANAIMGVTLVALRYHIAMLFSTDPEVVQIGANLIVMAGLFQLSDGMQAVGAGILRGLKDVKVPMYIAFVAYILINLPLGYLFAFVLDFGPRGVWLGFIGGLTTAAVLFRIRYMKQFKSIDETGKIR